MYPLRSRIEVLRKKQDEIEKSLASLAENRLSLRKEEVLSAFRTQDRTKIAPFRVVYVDINGNDNTGDGSFLNPFLTVKKGVDVANAISVNNVFVALGPATYLIDNPLDLPNNTFLIGWSNDTWVASPINAGLPVFTIANANADVNFVGGSILGLGLTGTGIEQTGIGSTVTARDFVMRNLGTGFRITNGAMFLNNVEISELDAITTGFDVSNGATMSVALNRTIDNATVTTLFNVDGSGTFLNLGGPTIVDTTNVSTFLKIDNGASAELLSAVVDGPSIGIEMDNGSAVSSVGSTFRGTTTDINVLDIASILNFVGAKLDKNKIILPAGFQNENMLFQDNTEDEEATKVYGDFFVGRPERGTTLRTGQGEPTTRGMVVLTTDNTASAVSDGGNFIDVSTAAKSFSGSIFSFQGVTANHTILIGDTLADAIDVLQHSGLFIIQTTAAVEVTPRSFVFEYWDGAAWVEATVLSIEDINSYRYGNEVFIRANTREHIRYNADIFALWQKKLINGQTLFWSRIRIAITVTTAPVFEQFRLPPNFGEFSEDGYSRYYGRARFRTTLLSFGNIWGESGGVLDASVLIGSGGLPTGWDHEIKNGQLNGAGDAIYLNIIIPRGICTASSMKLRLIYHPEQAGASTDATIIFSVLPIEIQGTLEADPAGGVTPVNRTLANTELVTANTAQVTNRLAPMVVPDKLQTIESDPVDISNYYEGDEVAIRIEFDQQGSGNKDLIIWGVELNAVQWALGERLQ